MSCFLRCFLPSVLLTIAYCKITIQYNQLLFHFLYVIWSFINEQQSFKGYFSVLGYLTVFAVTSCSAVTEVVSDLVLDSGLPLNTFFTRFHFDVMVDREKTVSILLLSLRPRLPKIRNVFNLTLSLFCGIFIASTILCEQAIRWKILTGRISPNKYKKSDFYQLIFIFFSADVKSPEFHCKALSYLWHLQFFNAQIFYYTSYWKLMRWVLIPCLVLMSMSRSTVLSWTLIDPTDWLRWFSLPDPDLSRLCKLISSIELSLPLQIG